jgi:hypothetical protein
VSVDRLVQLGVFAAKTSKPRKLVGWYQKVRTRSRVVMVLQNAFFRISWRERLREIRRPDEFRRWVSYPFAAGK